MCGCPFNDMQMHTTWLAVSACSVRVAVCECVGGRV